MGCKQYRESGEIEDNSQGEQNKPWLSEKTNHFRDRNMKKKKLTQKKPWFWKDRGSEVERIQFSSFRKVTQGFTCPEYEVLLWFGCKGSPDAHVLKFRSQNDGLSTLR